MAEGRVVSLACHPVHAFSKPVVPTIRLITGEGVEGDAHCGERVKHRSRVRVNPDQPNLRQVHFLSVELLAMMAEHGFAISPGMLGENILTEGVDLHALGQGTRLRLGDAEVEITGLRNPCQQIEDFRPGLLKVVLTQAPDGGLIRRAGIMGIVKHGGRVETGARFAVIAPSGVHIPLERV